MNFVVGGDFGAGRREDDQVRGTKYEVRSERVRRNGVAQREMEEAKPEQRVGTNPCTCDVEAPLVRRASVTHMGISIAAFFENFIGTGVEPNLSQIN